MVNYNPYRMRSVHQKALYQKKRQKKVRQKELARLRKKYSKAHPYNRSKTLAENIRDYFKMSITAYEWKVNRKCQVCSKVRATQLHHVIPKSQGGSNELSNLKAVCKNCHNHIHNTQVANPAGCREQSTASDGKHKTKRIGRYVDRSVMNSLVVGCELVVQPRPFE